MDERRRRQARRGLGAGQAQAPGALQGVGGRTHAQRDCHAEVLALGPKIWLAPAFPVVDSIETIARWAIAMRALRQFNMAV